MRQPLFNEHPLEIGLLGREARVIAMLGADVKYRALFEASFPAAAPISIKNIIKAIAAFERTLISGRAAFDRYVFDDDRAALSLAAKQGMALFYSSRVGCARCHFGLNFSGPIAYAARPVARAIYANTALYCREQHGICPGKFRVPTLRNIALTAPYMHDGSLASLDQVIDHYAQGGWQGSAARQLRPFSLSVAEKYALIEFLKSLTDAEFARR